MKWWRRQSRREEDLADEIEFDLAAEAELRSREGLTRDEAVQESRRNFGNATLIRENVREAWGWAALARLKQDAAFGLRMLRRNPLFASLAILSLAAGIGANAAIYSVISAAVFRELPVTEPHELAIVSWQAANPASGFREPPGVDFVDGSVRMGSRTEPRSSPNFPCPFYASLRDAGSSAFEEAIAHKDAGQLTLTVHGRAELAGVEFVSGNFFQGLGVGAAGGRVIGEADDTAGADPVAVLGYDYWRAHFAADPHAIGQTVRIGRVTYTICGVAAAGFFGLSPGTSPALYIPISTRPLIVNDSVATALQKESMFTDRRSYWTDIILRLRGGVTRERAEAEVAARFRRYVIAAGGDPARADFPTARLEDGSTGLDSLRRQYSKPLVTLMAMVGFILMIACANIANLLLARAAARRREIAVRLSLGASRARVIRQLLIESLLLSLPGGLLGLSIAAAGVPFLLWLMGGGDRGFALDASLDWRVLAFMFGISLASGALFGLAPALHATRVDIAPALKGTRILSAAGTRFGLSRVLVTVQVALSLLLVFGAVLFVRTLSNLRRVDLGYSAENLLTFDANASKAGYKGASLNPFYNKLEKQLQTIAGVASVAASASPLAKGLYSTPVRFPSGDKGSAGWTCVGTSYFQTLGVPILAGRAFRENDTRGSHTVAIVNQTLASKYFGQRSPVGEHIGILDGFQYDATVVGVAADIRESIRDLPRPFVYLPFNQFAAPEWRGMSFIVRSIGDPAAIEAAVQRTLHDAAPDVPAANMMTLRQRIDGLLSRVSAPVQESP